jgi:hypothetical protein
MQTVTLITAKIVAGWVVCQFAATVALAAYIIIRNVVKR